ncbi:hypothetical protein Golax_019527 [Gossypium laxum]|uniref:RNase H type-1 domain-containing protein n=1 Tax=Gossypium laxum TaxID=34288 RepID=A0A7J8Z7Z5_9ROSI|nr:hypothetical protein [Gossypium laxum]
MKSASLNTQSWSKTMTCIFSVKSAYRMLKEEFWSPKDVYGETLVMEMQQTSKNEELGILDGLFLLQKQGYDEVAIQSDNLEILAKEEKWCLRYVPREAIKIDDALEKMALSNDEVLHMFYDLPLEIEEVL